MRKILAGALVFTLASTSISSAQGTQIIGEDRFDTSGKIADKYGTYDSVILVNGDSIADGLAASSLSGEENAPILLCQKNKIPKTIKDRLNGVSKVFIIGGENAISKNVEDSLDGKSVIRLGGKSRIETSMQVANYLGDYNSTFIVNGFKGEADAMSVASAAARDHIPIILTNGKSTEINPNPGKTNFVIGGTDVVNNNIKDTFNAERISGRDRYETNLKVLQKFYPDTKVLYCTKGDDLVDALIVSPLARKSGVLLVSKTSDKRILVNKYRIQVGGMPFDLMGLSEEDIYLQYLNSSKVRQEAKREFYRLLQKERISTGNKTIKTAWQLEESAYLKSKHMADHVYFSHSPKIVGLHYDSYRAECIVRISYKKSKLSDVTGKMIGERMFDLWKNSPGHYRIMMNEYPQKSVSICGYDYFVTPYTPKFNNYISVYGTYHSGNRSHITE